MWLPYLPKAREDISHHSYLSVNSIRIATWFHHFPILQIKSEYYTYLPYSVFQEIHHTQNTHNAAPMQENKCNSQIWRAQVYNWNLSSTKSSSDIITSKIKLYWENVQKGQELEAGRTTVTPKKHSHDPFTNMII